VTARELSQQPAAVRQRKLREKRRHALSLVAEAPSMSPPPVTPAPSLGPTVTQEAAAAPVTTPPSITLLETEVVTGDGAEAYATTLELGAEGEAGGAIPLVDAPAPPPAAAREPVSREKAALVGKIVAAYVRFGWGVLVHDHHDKLAAIADQLLKGHPELDALTPEQKWQIGFSMMVGTVEESTIALCIKYNIHIPYADEGIVGVGVGTATLGVVRAFTTPANENDGERLKQAKDANAPATPRDSNASPATPRDSNATPAASSPEPVRAVRATNRGPQ
jgi:hypothetical protein